MTDASEAVVNRYAYDSFGRVAGVEAVWNDITFTGREYDLETGLLYLRARYYDPEAGRFVSKDPIGFAGGDVNLYGYVLGNPVNWVDPSGTSTLSISLNLSSWLGAFGGGGGPAINFGYDKKESFSFSVTATAGAGAATGVGGALGVRVGVTNASTVDQLLGTSVESARAFGRIEVTGIAGQGYKGVELGFTIAQLMVSIPWHQGLLPQHLLLYNGNNIKGLIFSRVREIASD